MPNKDDFMRYVNQRLNKKRMAVERGRKAANSHIYENSCRIHKRLKRVRRLGHKEW